MKMTENIACIQLLCIHHNHNTKNQQLLSTHLNFEFGKKKKIKKKWPHLKGNLLAIL